MDLFDLRRWPGFTKAGGDHTVKAAVDQITIDSRRIYSSNALFVALSGSRHDGHQFVASAAESGCRYALVRKSWKPSKLPQGITLLWVDDPLRAFQEITKSYRQQLPCKVIGITGSFGKTMVKDLLHAMLSTSKCVVASPESFNSQIGVPLSLLQIQQEHEIALIEAGISKKNEMDSLAEIMIPQSCLMTHIGRKHIATLGSLENITTEMAKLLKSAPKKGWSVLPRDRLLKPHLLEIKTRKYFWDEQDTHLPHAEALASEHTVRVPYRIVFPDGYIYENDITFGHFYFLDLLNLTIKPAWLLGISSEAICETLSSYTPEPMRTEIWQSPMGATFINDTYCSDPQSVDQALRYMDQCSSSRKIFIFGGIRGKTKHLDKDYRRIGKAIHQSAPKLLMLIGNHPFDSLIDEVRCHSPQMEVYQYPSYDLALQELKEKVKSEDSILIKGERKEPLDRLMEAFHGSICTNQCFINLSAVTANLSMIREKIGHQTRMMVMVKALAYGTNDIRMAKYLETLGIDIFGVSYVDEGIALRRSGVRQSIFTLNTAPYEASKVVEWDLEIGVSNKEVIDAIAKEAAEKGKTLKVHLHVDTGMSRLGCRPEETHELAKYILSYSSLKLEGIMTHFACAENPEEDPFTLSQAEHFAEVILELKKHDIEIPWKHAANSSAVMRFDFPQFNMVRIGLAIYGLSPSKAAKKSLDLRPALSLTSRIVGINLCKKGETVSYGRNYTINEDNQRIAVVPFGYFDGLHRNYSGKGFVMIHGRKAPMVGSICMDYMMVDVTHIPNTAIGDHVLIFGEDEFGNNLPPEELAECGNSIVYELVTCLGPRIQRIFVHEENQKSC